MNSPLKPNPKVFQSPSLFIEPECILPVQMLYNRRVRHQLVLICELYWWLSLLSISLSLSSGWLSPPSIYTHKSSSPSPLLTCALYNKQICWKREKKTITSIGRVLLTDAVTLGTSSRLVFTSLRHATLSSHPHSILLESSITNRYDWMRAISLTLLQVGWEM